LFIFLSQVGVQCAIDPDDGTNALEEKVNSVMPLAPKSESDHVDGGSCGDNSN
jgi:hypothetical protein